MNLDCANAAPLDRSGGVDSVLAHPPVSLRETLAGLGCGAQADRPWLRGTLAPVTRGLGHSSNSARTYLLYTTYFAQHHHHANADKAEQRVCPRGRASVSTEHVRMTLCDIYLDRAKQGSLTCLVLYWYLHSRHIG